jgi:hypothetical protein
MKALLASFCSIFAASAAGAASVTVPDNSTSLAGVAAATTALLLDAGLKPQNAGGGVFVLDAKNFHCDQHLNGALDASSVRAGLPTSNAGSTPRTSAARTPVRRSARTAP